METKNNVVAQEYTLISKQALDDLKYQKQFKFLKHKWNEWGMHIIH